MKKIQILYRDQILEWDDRRGIQTGKLDRHPAVFSSYQSPTYKLHSSANIRTLNEIKQLLDETCKAKNTDDLLNTVFGLLTA